MPGTAPGETRGLCTINNSIAALTIARGSLAILCVEPDGMSAQAGTIIQILDDEPLLLTDEPPLLIYASLV